MKSTLTLMLILCVPLMGDNAAKKTFEEIKAKAEASGAYAFECVVDGSRCGVGTARSKKDAKERAAALALRALARAQPGAAPAVAYTDRTRAPGRRGAADLKGARGSGVLGGVANAAVEPVAAAAAPLWQRAPGPQVGPPGFL